MRAMRLCGVLMIPFDPLQLNLASQSVLEGLNACLDHRSEVGNSCEISKYYQAFHIHPVLHMPYTYSRLVRRASCGSLRIDTPCLLSVAGVYPRTGHDIQNSAPADNSVRLSKST